MFCATLIHSDVDGRLPWYYVHFNQTSDGRTFCANLRKVYSKISFQTVPSREMHSQQDGVRANKKPPGCCRPSFIGKQYLSEIPLHFLWNAKSYYSKSEKCIPGKMVYEQGNSNKGLIETVWIELLFVNLFTYVCINIDLAAEKKEYFCLTSFNFTSFTITPCC